MGKGGKSAERIVVVTDQFLIKIDTKKNKVMDKEPLSVITGLSIFDYNGSKIGELFFVQSTVETDFITSAWVVKMLEKIFTDFDEN